jgi:hypothetical protein
VNDGEEENDNVSGKKRKNNDHNDDVYEGLSNDCVRELAARFNIRYLPQLVWLVGKEEGLEKRKKAIKENDDHDSNISSSPSVLNILSSLPISSVRVREIINLLREIPRVTIEHKVFFLLFFFTFCWLFYGLFLYFS